MVNDVLGHSEGDRFLMKAAEILVKACRPTDIVARWGGDEYIILLPNTDSAGAEQVCENIRKSH